MSNLLVIPARYDSSRFPGKPLTKLLDQPMIIWVADISAIAVGRENVFIATDDKRIAEEANNNGYKSLMTSPNHLTGTDRIAEAVKNIECDILYYQDLIERYEDKYFLSNINNCFSIVL